ncbi:unnamed protein product [Calicophoron daubneyi]|uniref:Sphingomyelin phosphodiesterase C-terminal domain-containing protein n=1 Tax=Calicophoron daubneyi TaxID=300641 RepID=A0AAV2T5H4_CALDB
MLALIQLLLGLHFGWCAQNNAFWYYTDLNVDLQYEIEDDTDLWGAYDNDTSRIVAFTGIEMGNDLGYAENEPSFVIWGGNAAPNSQKVGQKEITEALKWTAYELKHAFNPKRIPVYPLLGETDVYPFGSMSPDTNNKQREQLCASLYNEKDLWQQWFKKLEKTPKTFPKSNFSKVCYFAAPVPNNTRITVMALNSLVWYVGNDKIDTKNKDPLGQFEWMQKVLKWSKDQKGKVIIVSHFPIGALEQSPDVKYLHPVYNKKLVNILLNYSDSIMTVLSSHERVDTFKILLNESNCPVGSIFLNPSVSPKAIGKVDSSNPRIRRYNFSADSYVIEDYRQYWLDLSKKAPGWDIEYEAKKTYNFRNMSTLELVTLLDEFTESDEGRWKTYWNHELGSRPHKSDADCSRARSKCRCQHICAMRNVDFDRLKDCLKICDSSKNPKLDTISKMCWGTHDSAAIPSPKLWLLPLLIMLIRL